MAKALLPHAEHSTIYVIFSLCAREKQMFKCRLLSGNSMSLFFFTAPSGFLNNTVCWNSIVLHTPPLLLFGCLIPTWLLLSHSLIAIDYPSYLQSLHLHRAASELQLLKAPRTYPNISFASVIGPTDQLALNWREQYNTTPVYSLPRYSVRAKIFVPHCGSCLHPRLEACRRLIALSKASKKSLLALNSQLQILLHIQKYIFFLKLLQYLSLEVLKNGYFS